MKTKIGILVLALSISFFNLQAQRIITTTRATSYDISDNLDLDAVASIFGDSENLEDFERRLNDPENRISNLDLNEDGYIDYLRVVENSEERNTLIVVQAVLGKDIYQDVTTIEIEKTQNSSPRIQVVGDSYIYGSNYIIEPVYVRTPLIFSFFWSPRYRSWHSPYYWNYYPKWYHSYRTYSPFKYQKHVYQHINYHNSYHRSTSRNGYFSREYHNNIRRSDFATRHPDRSFMKRHEGMENRNDLNQRREYKPNSYRRSESEQRPSTRQYQYNKRSDSERNESKRNEYQNHRPTYNSHSKPDSKPSVSREQPISAPKRSANQVESEKRTSVTPEKAETRSRHEKSSTNERSRQRTIKKANQTEEESKKESGERRRTE